MSWLDGIDPHEDSYSAKLDRSEKRRDAYTATINEMVTSHLRDLAVKAFGKNDFTIERGKDSFNEDWLFKRVNYYAHTWTARRVKGYPRVHCYELYVLFKEETPLRFGCGCRGYLNKIWLDKIVEANPREMPIEKLNQSSLRKLLIGYYKQGPDRAW